jgi:hypothetical protein
MEMFVAGTMVIDIRNGNFIKPGDPIPKDALVSGTLKACLDKGSMLPFSEENRYKLNPRQLGRLDVRLPNLPSNIQRSEPDNVKQLVTVAEETVEPPKEEGPRKLVVGVPETPPPAPPTPENIWTFNAEELEYQKDEVLQSLLVERCKQFDIEVPVIEQRDSLIAFMSKDFPGQGS